MSNQAQRRPSGLVTPGGGQQQQGVDPELLAAIQQSQPSKEEQARIAGVQIATQLHLAPTKSMFRDIDHFIQGAEQISDYLFSGRRTKDSAPATDGGQ